MATNENPRRGGAKVDPNRVRERMAALGISQGGLAKVVGMTQGGISSILAGDSGRPTKLREIAEALGTSQEYLLGVSDDPGLSLSEAEFLSVLRGLSPRDQQAVMGLAHSLRREPEPAPAPPASRRR